MHNNVKRCAVVVITDEKVECSVALARGQVARFSPEDASLVAQYSWSECEGYPLAGKNKKPQVKLHIAVAKRMGLDLTGKEVDHINGKPLDCRRENLRAATRSQNVMNTARRKDNRSGVKGVRWSKGAWQARIRLNGQEMHLGRFAKLEDAAKARRDKELELFGEFARKEG